MSDTTGAWAQSESSSATDDLSSARALFSTALRDEEARHFPEALEKFEQVRSVRDTAPVEYRIGTCREAMGQAIAAHVAYRRAIAIGLADARSGDVIAAARERLEVLEKHLASLKLVLVEGIPLDAEVRVDDGIVPVAALGEPIVLEPGRHVVTAHASEARPFTGEIVLAEGTQATLPLALERRANVVTAVVQPGIVAGAPAREAPRSSSAERTLAWIGLGGGAALLAGSAVLWLVRSGDIARLRRDCPGDVCPVGSDRADLESTRSRALVEGPLAITLGAAGLAAAGSGAYLLVTANGRSSGALAVRARVAPFVAKGSTGIAVAGDF